MKASRHFVFAALCLRASHLALATMLGLGLVAAQSHASETKYPVKPARVLIPFSAGGALDAVARPLGEAYGKKTGQSWVIENLGGAGGVIAATRAVRDEPDGYHLFMGSSGQVSIAPYVYPSLPYDPLKDLIPIVHLADSTAVLYTTTDSPYKTVQDLVAAEKSASAPIAFAHTGNGSVSHLAMELFATRTNTTFNAIPYKGAGVAIGDLAGGQVPLLFTFVSTAKPLLDAGRIRPLAVAADQRLASLPDVPTFAESGIDGVVAKLWIGLMAPKNTPSSAIDSLSATVNELLKTDDLKRRLEPQGLEIQGGTAKQFAAMIAEDSARWRDLSKTVDIQAK